MTIDGNDLINSILASLERVDYIRPADIPNIELYMDQVTTFMDSRLRSTLRYPDEDKILTKTMINNYAKNDLLPPPVRKKYSKEHILLLIFIYYYKGVLSISDIQTLLEPITTRFFHNTGSFHLQDIYEEAYHMGKEQLDALKEDVKRKYAYSQQTFENAPKEDQDFLKKFAFICSLSFDVYIKKLIIEKMIDEIAAEKKRTEPDRKSDKKSEKKKKPQNP